jgi:hypothetical protein
VAAPLRTVVKNRSVVALSAPSATPVLFVNVRMRPLATSRYCVDPTSPDASGNTALVSGSAVMPCESTVTFGDPIVSARAPSPVAS